MPIVGSETIQSNFYRLTITMGSGIVDNILITPDGIYSVYFIRNGRYYNATGRIPKVVMDYRCPQNSYILFDYSADRSARRERIYFSQVQFIKDITPNSAYKIAVDHGFDGTIEEWLTSMHGEAGKSAYEIAVECGYSGTKDEWIESLKGSKGDPGKSAYEIAVDHGFKGTEEEWLAQLGDAQALAQEIKKVDQKVNIVAESVVWVDGMGEQDGAMVKALLDDAVNTRMAMNLNSVSGISKFMAK